MIKNIKEFVEKAGSLEIAQVLNVHQWTVQRWVATGIPVKYWKILIREFRITPDDLARFTMQALNEKNVEKK